MQAEKGFVYYKQKSKDVYIVLHSGPQFGPEAPLRDTNADAAASLAARMTGSSLALATLPRNPEFGIDLNRAAPTFSIARRPQDTDFIDNYAWAAKSKEEHEMKAEIYRSFWSSVQTMGERFFLVHTASPRLACIPSVLDIITLDEMGISREQAAHIAEKLNKKFAPFLRSVEDVYRRTIAMEYYANFYKVHMQKERDAAALKQHGYAAAARRLLAGDIVREELIAAVEGILKNCRCSVTVERTFSGKKAFAPKQELAGKMAIEIELSRAMQHFPDGAARMLAALQGMV